MAGRKAYPYVVMKATNSKKRLTKEELDRRKENEPTIKSNVMRCPSHLSDGAKKEWRRIVKLYGEFEKPLLTDLDVNALEIYCESLITYRKAMQNVRKTTEVYIDKHDQSKPRKNPWLAVANEAAMQIKKYGEILLLDPVSRARVGMAKSNDEAEDPMAAFIRRRTGNER